MKTENLHYIPRIDHLRFFAALSVMIFHFVRNEYTEPLDVGINLFFTLSGFIFMLITEAGEQEVDYRKFIYNRFLRIFPLVLVLFFTTIAVMREKFRGTDLFNLLFLNMPSGAGQWGYGGEFLSFPWWTIGVEFSFYLIFPFILKFYQGYGLKYLFQLIVFVLVLRYLVYYTRGGTDGWGNTIMSIHFSILGHLDTFIIGMLAAILYKNRVNLATLFKILSSNVFLLIVLAVFYKVMLLDVVDSMLAAPLRAVFCSIIILSYLTIKFNFGKILEKCIAYLGTISFSIYLLHEFIYEAFKAMEIPDFVLENFAILSNSSEDFQKLILAIAVYIPCICLFSALSYIVIEKPFLRLRVKYLKDTGQEVSMNQVDLSKGVGINYDFSQSLARIQNEQSIEN